MGAADVIVLSLVALADLCLLVYLRRRRLNRVRDDRMARHLRFAVQREIALNSVEMMRRDWRLRRAV